MTINVEKEIGIIHNNIKKTNYMVGIIPVAGRESNFNFPWHDCLTPLGDNFLAIERAISECLFAGCKSIWIVADHDMQPLLRYRIGDFVYDPMSLIYFNKFVGYNEYSQADNLKEVPIYYVPIHPKDKKRRNSIAWSILYGAHKARSVTNRMSGWFTPDKNYVAFPYGIQEAKVTLFSDRKEIGNWQQDFYTSFNGKTVKDNEYLSFAFCQRNYMEYVKNYKNLYDELSLKKLSIKNSRDESERNIVIEPETWFALDRVFGRGKISTQTTVNLPWFYDMKTWDNYADFMASSYAKEFKRPKLFLDHHTYSKLGEQENESNE